MRSLRYLQTGRVPAAAGSLIRHAPHAHLLPRAGEGVPSFGALNMMARLLGSKPVAVLIVDAGDRRPVVPRRRLDEFRPAARCLRERRANRLYDERFHRRHAQSRSAQIAGAAPDRAGARQDGFWKTDPTSKRSLVFHGSVTLAGKRCWALPSVRSSACCWRCSSCTATASTAACCLGSSPRR